MWGGRWRGCGPIPLALAKTPQSPLIPAQAGTQIQPRAFRTILNLCAYELGPGLRRDERIEVRAYA
jgi:hypothetical protein